MGWMDLAKLLSGFFLAMTLIASAGLYAAQYVIAQFTVPPPRPTFANDGPASQAKPVAAPAKPIPVRALPSPSPLPQQSPTPKAVPIGYSARITISLGLNVREGPGVDTNRVGGVDYDERVVVLEDSADREWQRVRLEGSGVEGWIKSGYTEREN
jgi:uncharacterized protein YgiM (DUF1202 family)